MKALAIISSVLLLCAATWGFSQFQNNQKLFARVSDFEAQLKSAKASQEKSAGEAEDLRLKLQTVAIELTNSTARLIAVNNQIAEYKKSQMEAPPERDARKMLMEQVPIIATGNSIVFPSLPSKTGKELAVGAEYKSISGRKLFFKTGEGAFSGFDIDVLHPGVLAQLNIDADAAKASQLVLDKKSAALSAAINRGGQDAVQAQARWLAEKAKSDADEAQRAERLRQQRFAEDLRARAVESDRIRANAAATEAAASVISAARSYP